MRTPPTTRLYLQDSHCFESDARIVGVRENSVVFGQSCFYPGGGGQPADEGSVRLASGELLTIVSVQVDPDDVVWHISTSRLRPAILGQPAGLIVNRQRRLSLMRYHTVLHVLNTIALRDYGGWITGVQIAADYSRIDFKDEQTALCPARSRRTAGHFPCLISNACGPTGSFNRIEDDKEGEAVAAKLFCSDRDLVRQWESSLL